MAQRLKCLPAMWETWVQSLGWKDSLEKEMTTHSSILAWRIPWTEEPSGLQSKGSQRVGLNWVTFTFTCCFSLLFSGTLHSVGYTFPFLPCFSLLFFPQLFVRPPQTTTLPFCISFPCGWFWSMPPIQYYKLPSIVLQAHCLPELISWIYSSPPLYNYRKFDLGSTWMA